MKAYIETEREDLVLRRVTDALWRYAPDDVEIVERPGDADLVVMHVIGRQDRTTRDAGRILDRGQQYAIIQYSVRSTLRPCTSGWLPIWRRASVVWSYYPLEKWCQEDWTPFDFNFYHRPLGVDSTVFYPRNRRRKFIIGTCGHSAVVEGIREAAFASQRVGQPMFHLGPELTRQGVKCYNNLDDEALAALLSRCHFVAALRRTEGLELMAVEGLLCGARPICFDRDHYRAWYEPWAIFIPETNRDGVIDNLASIFREGPMPITEKERAAAAEQFNWKHIIEGFWNKVL